MSTATISYVFNGKGHVSKEIRNQVLKTAEELGYVRKKSDPPASSRLIRLYCADMETLPTHLFFNELLTGILSVTLPAGYDVIVTPTRKAGEGDLPEGVGPAVVFAADIPECKGLAGKNVTVCYGNIRITRNGKTAQDIFPGQNAELPKNLVSYVSVNPGVRVQYGIAGKSPKTGEALPEVLLLLWVVSGIALTGVVCQRKRGQIKRRL